MVKLIFLFLIFCFFLAMRYLPWWGILAFFVGIYAFGKFLGPWIARLILMRLFGSKSKALRNAKAEFSAVQAITRSDADDTRPHYELEVAVTPLVDATAQFQLWEPGELRFVPPGTPRVGSVRDGTDEPDVVEVVNLEVYRDGKFEKEEGLKYSGPQRLKLIIATQPGVNALMLRYYFEDFAQLQLPQRAAA